MNTKEKIEFYTCDLEDRARNMWKVIEASDLQDILETYHQEQLKLLNIDFVSVSDSEIDNYATNQAQEYSDFEGEQIEIAESLSEGAKWMRDKIKTH